MKKISIKLKITLWYTVVMILISCAALVIMTSASQEMIEHDISERITKSVMTLSRMLDRPNDDRPNDDRPNDYRLNDYRPDDIDIHIPKLGFYEQGVHLMVCDDNNNIIAGNIPFEISDSSELIDNEMQTITDNKNKYYIYTAKVRHKNGKETPYWVKGVVSVTDEMYAVRSAAKNNIILTVIMIIMAAAGGYFIISRVLSPVDKIRNTAEKISESSDLSQRINIGEGKDEIHSLANTFDNMLDKIEQTVEREKQFTSDASHELRTPVAVILSECEYMTDCAETYGEIKESAYSVKNQAEKMSKLISGLLTISRMDRNTMQTEFEETDISELLNFVCDEQSEIHSENITLHRNIEPDITANADRFLLARMFINLISNAYSYGKDGGNITVSLSQDKENIAAKVADDGIGIAEEDIPKIWERFYQVDPSRTANKNGSMGLGLSMVKWIAECHSGKISVQSELGTGSTFTLTMPKYANEQKGD